MDVRIYLFNFSIVSQDPGNYDDAPTEGIRRVLETVTGQKIARTSILETDKIGVPSSNHHLETFEVFIMSLDCIRLSTTVATNALLERKGHKHALLITRRFNDLLLNGNQSRP